MNIRRHLLLSGVFAALSAYALAAEAKFDVVPACENASGHGNSVVNANNKHCVENTKPASGDIMQNPEIDGAGAITAGAMLAGILALVGERRRRKGQ